MSNFVKCPICGELMPIKYHYAPCFGDPEDCCEELDHISCRCKNCKVTFISGHEYPTTKELYDYKNWKLPKDFVPTITEKQRKCIYAISNNLGIVPDPCFTKELATAWIAAHNKESKEKIANRIYEDKVNSVIYDANYTLYKTFDAKPMFNRAVQSISFEKGKLERLIRLEGDGVKIDLTGDNVAHFLYLDVVKKMEQEYQEVKRKIEEIPETTSSEVDGEIKARSEDHGYSDYDDDYECGYDFGDLC